MKTLKYMKCCYHLKEQLNRLAMNGCYEKGLLWETLKAFQVNTNFKKCFKLVCSSVISTTQNTHQSILAQ